MRRIIMIIFLLYLSSIAFAEIPCQCNQTQCTCFIQLGDKGIPVEFIQNALIEQGYLPPSDDHTTFDDCTRNAVLAFQTANHLSATGCMDDATLTLLLWGMLPEALDQADPLSSSLLVWIPTDGGKRHHDDPGCSGMYDPRCVSQRNALAMNMLHCGRCKPPGYSKQK